MCQTSRSQSQVVRCGDVEKAKRMANDCRSWSWHGKSWGDCRREWIPLTGSRPVPVHGSGSGSVWRGSSSGTWSASKHGFVVAHRCCTTLIAVMHVIDDDLPPPPRLSWLLLEC